MRTRTANLSVSPLEDRSTPAGLDPSFGTAGIATWDLGGNDLLDQSWSLPGGGTLGLATKTGPEGQQSLLVKLTAAGAPDATFGTGGAAVVAEADWQTPDAPRPAGTVVVRLAGGSILVVTSLVDPVPVGPPELIDSPGTGGQAWYTPPPKLVGRVELTKFSADGVRDEAYGTRALTFPGDGQTFASAAVLADGSVILASQEFTDSTPPSTTPDESYRVPVPKVAVAKLTPAGEPDRGFGTDGLLTVNPGEGVVYGVTVYPAGDGFLLVGGRQGTDADPTGDTFTIPTTVGFAAKFTAAGAADTSYGDNGVAKFAQGVAADRAVAVAADGTLTAVVVAQSAGPMPMPAPGPAEMMAPPPPAASLIRLTAAGAPDAAFGTGGSAVLDSPHYSSGVVGDPYSGPPAFRLASRADGGVYVVASGRHGVAVQRFDARGVLDTAYAHAGSLVLAYANAGTGTTTPVVATATAGGLVLAGWTNGAREPKFGGVSNDLWFAHVGDAAATPPIPEPPQPPEPGEPPVIGEPGPLPPVIIDNGGLVPPTFLIDVTGDGVADNIALPGVGATTVTVTDGTTGEILSFDPYEAGFLGGVVGAVGDLDGDGVAELVLGPDVGGGARIQVYDLRGLKTALRDNFFAIDDAAFRGGARVAVGDVNGDGNPDVIVGAGPGGGPRVAVFDGTALLGMAAKPGKLVNDFFAFPGDDAARLRDGVSVSAADVDGDGKADLMFGAGPGGAPRVLVVDGAQVAAGKAALAQHVPLANFYAGNDADSRGGVVLTFDPATLKLTAFNPATGKASEYGLDDLGKS